MRTSDLTIQLNNTVSSEESTKPIRVFDHLEATNKLLDAYKTKNLFGEQMAATNKLLETFVGKNLLGDQMAATNKFLEAYKTKNLFGEQMAATNKLLDAYKTKNLFGEQMAATNKLLDAYKTKNLFGEQMAATNKLLETFVGKNLLGDQMAATNKLFEAFYAKNLVNEHLMTNKYFVEIVGSTLAKEYYQEGVSKFYTDLKADSLISLIKQAEAVDVSAILNGFNETDIYEFKTYSQQALSTPPVELIATETAKQSNFWKLFVYIFGQLFWIYVGLLLQAHQAQLNLPFLDNQTANTPKQVIIAAKKDVCAEPLSVCRFVTATELYVRVGAGKKYDVIDTLKFGQGVIIDALEVNEKDRDWVFITYYDHESGSYKSGWVYRRYLKRYIN